MNERVVDVTNGGVNERMKGLPQRERIDLRTSKTAGINSTHQPVPEVGERRGSGDELSCEVLRPAPFGL